jgi:aspartyl-tRNA(Asn)/glutamyl-tRNA(Gln) amidotransferase subunit C
MISEKEVRHIASLARIGLGEEEVEKYSKNLSAVLDWIDELKEVDVRNVEPTAHITGMDSISREDKSREFGNKENIIKLFPEEKNGYDKVKSVL